MLKLEHSMCVMLKFALVADRQVTFYPCARFCVGDVCVNFDKAKSVIAVLLQHTVDKNQITVPV